MVILKDVVIGMVILIVVVNYFLFYNDSLVLSINISSSICSYSSSMPISVTVV